MAITLPAKTRLLALLCRCCPFCVVARRFPESAYARRLAKLERTCPACRAYRRVHGRPATSTSPDTAAS